MANDTQRHRPEELIRAYEVAIVGYMLFCVLGTFINVWILVSIVRSKRLFANMRNQLICNMSVLHLTETLICFPIFFGVLLMYLYEIDQDLTVECNMGIIMTMIELTQSCVVDWSLVILTLVLLARILGLDLTKTLRPLDIRVGKIALLASPWLIAIAATPLSIYNRAFKYHDCLYFHPTYLIIYEVGYTVIPLCVSSLLIALAFLYRWRRYGFGSSSDDGNMGMQILGHDVVSEIDNVYAYLLAVAIAVVCESLDLIVLYEISLWKYRGYLFQSSAWFIAASRCALQPLAWLLFPDIRARVKTWRPWLKDTGTDMVATHSVQDDRVEIEA